MARKLKKLKTTESNRNADVVIDRLSFLPDAILVEILSLLPIKSAVSTTALSRRWRFLWTQITSINIDCRHFRSHETSDFYTIVNQLLTQLTSPLIRSSTLRFPYPQQEEHSSLVSSLIEPWLREICTRNVEIIKVTSEGSAPDLGSIFTIPPSIFQTQSLVELDLAYTVDYMLPDVVDNIRLPNLKKLCLRLQGSQCGFVGKLTRSCPSLDELLLIAARGWARPSTGASNDDGDVDNVIEISCGNLKILGMMFVGAPKTTRIVIDAPKLKTLIFLATTSLTCSFVKKPVALCEAAILTDSQAVLLSLLPVISNVRVLRIHPVTFIVLWGLEYDEGKGRPLIFPNLTDLCLQFGNERVGKLSSIPLEIQPPRLLTHVKKITIQVCDLEYGEQFLNLSKYLLSNAHVLEWLNFLVVGPSQSECKLEDYLEEISFCAELYGYPRSSARCEIGFSGQLVKLPAGVREMQDLCSAFCSTFSASLRTRT